MDAVEDLRCVMRADAMAISSPPDNFRFTLHRSTDMNRTDSQFSARFRRLARRPEFFHALARPLLWYFSGYSKQRLRDQIDQQNYPKEIAMKTKQLGNSDLNITPVGFGAWAIGGSGWEFAWGGQDDSDSIAAIHEALDAGVNWIDTAAVYGLGHSEEVVARALAGMSNRPYVFTKCSMIWDEKRQIGHSLRAESIRRECEASLRRLKVDAIDLYQIHWPDPEDEIEEGWETMAKLKAAGKVRHIGVSNFDVDQMERALALAPITSLQPRYSLIHREVEEEILPFAARLEIGVIAYSPMASGMLTGAMTKERIERLAADDWRRNHPDFQEPLLSRNLRW